MGRLNFISGDLVGASNFGLVQDGKLIVKQNGKTRIYRPEDIKGISKISAKKISSNNTNIFNNLFRMGVDLALLVGLGSLFGLAGRSGVQYKLRFTDGQSLTVKSGKDDYFTLRNMLLDSSEKVINTGNEIVRA